MALSDHLRELRARLLRSALVVVVAFGVALFFYDELFDLILIPYNEARDRLGQSVVTKVVLNDITGPLLLQLKLCGVVAVLAASHPCASSCPWSAQRDGNGACPSRAQP